ncbi:MAG: hypothetical protein JWR58_1232 [Pseudonocardia sp.]|jgi:hypothetical protein|nr:hypothetical protein [Pseudonocardia sp.]
MCSRDNASDKAWKPHGSYVSASTSMSTSRDTHEVEIGLRTGTPVATCQISNDTAGIAELLAWIVDHKGMTRERAVSELVGPGLVRVRLDDGIAARQMVSACGGDDRGTLPTPTAPWRPAGFDLPR